MQATVDTCVPVSIVMQYLQKLDRVKVISPIYDEIKVFKFNLTCYVKNLISSIEIFPLSKWLFAGPGANPVKLILSLNRPY